jgi:translation initiation factor 2B subunit (eIF-2B alpha/beta/delta family)
MNDLEKFKELTWTLYPTTYQAICEWEHFYKFGDDLNRPNLAMATDQIQRKFRKAKEESKKGIQEMAKSMFEMNFYIKNIIDLTQFSFENGIQLKGNLNQERQLILNELEKAETELKDTIR